MGGDLWCPQLAELTNFFDIIETTVNFLVLYVIRNKALNINYQSRSNSMNSIWNETCHQNTVHPVFPLYSGSVIIFLLKSFRSKFKWFQPLTPSCEWICNHDIFNPTSSASTFYRNRPSTKWSGRMVFYREALKLEKLKALTGSLFLH